MAEFEIRINKIKAAAGQERRTAEKLARACRRLQECQRELDTSVGCQYEVVKRSIQELDSRTQAAIRQIYGMAEALEEISRAYERTEREITGCSVRHREMTKAKDGGVSMEGVSDGLSAISKWIKALNDQADNPQAKTLAALLSMISSGMGLCESESIAQWFQSFVGFSGSTISFGGKLEKTILEMIEKHGTPSAKNWLQNNKSLFASEMKGFSTIGNSVSFASKFLGAIQDSDSFAAFLKNSGGWISSGGSLVGDLNGLKKEAVNGTVNPIVSLLSMAGYMAGDIIDLSTDGHPLTGDELANLCMGGGLTGVKTCVSQITFGLVDIDVDRSKNIFNKDIAWTTDKIASFGFPTGVQAALGVIASPFVAVYAMGETFVDMGYQIGDGIMSLSAMQSGAAGAGGGGGR